MAGAETIEHKALQAVVAHYNRLSATLAENPEQYRPMFAAHPLGGGVEPLFWCLGFGLATKFAPRAWKKVTDPHQPGHLLFEPIYAATATSHTTPDTLLGDIAKAVLAIRDYFMPARVRSSR